MEPKNQRQPQLTSAREIFEELFTVESLVEAFNEKFSTVSSKGIDRLNGFQFLDRAGKELKIASEKCFSETYRFSPYLEVLRVKGRGKPPRIIGIPTIRDRVILSQLNKFLAQIFPECIPRNVAATYVRKISDELAVQSRSKTWVCTTDIRTFYDSIQRQRLMTLLAQKINYQPALSLIGHALVTPTVPKNTRKKRHADFKSENGVPQGLAVSNILASIYMQPIDNAMEKLGVAYYRYVDDVLMYGDLPSIEAAFKSLAGRLKRRGLGVHPLNSGKSQIERVTASFGYLGYVFDDKTITIRDSTVERFLQSIAARFSDFAHNKSKRLEKFKYLNEERLKQIFLMELNERITGAVKDQKRYGWIAYFSQITDLTLLHKLDHTISGLFSRLKEFGNVAPLELRTLRRSYWEIRFNPQGGYVRDYDAIETTEQQLQFLEARGRVAPEEALTDQQIRSRYEKYVKRSLAAMLADEGSVYG